jgi:hypothetical protein
MVRCDIHKYSSAQIKVDMDGTCIVCGEIRMHTKFWSDSLKEEDNFGGVGVHGRVTKII